MKHKIKIAMQAFMIGLYVYLLVDEIVENKIAGLAKTIPNDVSSLPVD